MQHACFKVLLGLVLLHLGTTALHLCLWVALSCLCCRPEHSVACLQFGVYMAYALVAYCYFGVAFTGYNAFGVNTGDQILYSLGHPVWVVCVASVMVIVHVCGSFQVS